MIEVRGLRKVFKSRRTSVEAVAGIDLDVERGEMFGFLGPNGAGKTTTLRMLATLLPPTDGQARVAGADLRHEPGEVRRRIGYVGQKGGTDPQVTGRSELHFQGRAYGMASAQTRARADELIQVLDLESCADRTTGTYSGGQKRRLDIALGLMHRPQLLFLDEPSTGLDPQSRAHLWDEIRRLRSEGTTIFVTTHYLEEADALCDRLAIIDGGRIVAEGSPDQLKSEVAGDVVTMAVAGDAAAALELLRKEPYTREGELEHGRVRLIVENGDQALPRILRTLDGAGLSPQTIALSRPSLDDVFLRHTGRSLRDEEVA